MSTFSSHVVVSLTDDLIPCWCGPCCTLNLEADFFPDCLANTTKKLQRAVSIDHLNSNCLIRRKKEPCQALGLRKNLRPEMEGSGPFLRNSFLGSTHEENHPLRRLERPGRWSWVLTGVCTPAEAFHSQHICKVSLLCGFLITLNVWLKDSLQSGHLQGFSPACVFRWITRVELWRKDF